MCPSRRQRNASVHSIAFSLLLFTVASLNEIKLSEGCTSRTYPVLLTNETAPLTNTTNSSIITAINDIVNETCGVNVILNATTTPDGMATKLELSVTNEDQFNNFEDAFLKGITYGNDSKTMMPLSRVFMVTFNVSDPATNNSVLEQAMKKVLGGDPIVTLFTNGSQSRTFRLWLDIGGSKYPTEALHPLQRAIQNGSLSGAKVQENSFKAYTVYPVLEKTMRYQVNFDYSNQECDPSKISNISSAEYISLKNELVTLLNASFSVLPGYVEVEVTALQCGPSSNARAAVKHANVVAQLKLNKSSMSTPTTIGEALNSCSSSQTKISNLEVTLLNPTSFDAPSKATIICPTTTQPPTTQRPTKQPTGKTSPLPSTEPSTPPPTLGKTPRLFVRLRLALTWSQFCTKLEDSLKHMIAKNVYDKNGNVISPDRVVFINSNKNCADPTKADEQVDLWFYISEKSGSNKPSPCVTLKAQRVLKMMVNNGNTKMMGTDFAGKIISTNLAGCDAKKIDKKDNGVDWTLILIIIAIIVGAVLLFLACCCICCGAARRRRRKRYEDKHGNMELIIVDGTYIHPNGDSTKANGEGGKGEMGNEGKGNERNRNGRNGKGGKQGHKGGRARGYNDISDDDSDEYYDCCGAGRRSKPRKARSDKKAMNGKSDGQSKSDDKDDGKDAQGTRNNNDEMNTTDREGNSNEGYDDVNNSKQDGSSTPRSYRNLGFGLGDRKPSTGNEYATIGDSKLSNNTDNKERSTGGVPSGAAGVAAGATTGLLAGAINEGAKRGSITPAIVTSPAPDTGTPLYANAGTSASDRRGSAAKSGTPVSSRPPSGTSLGNIDDEQLRERRRSSIHSLVDDAEPLKHKTATVGIVGLALRNKNERKKETEFKNLDKEMPALGTYPGSTAGKNRFPEILPNPRSRVKLSSSPDYINASYLHDHKGQRHYIATQHPLVESEDDFWQMVWDQESYLIVMVNDDENSKQMEYPIYWPAAQGETKNFNGITVSNKQVVTKTDYAITTLAITDTRVKQSVTREITHYRYTSWKNKDQVPNVAMFVGFVVATREIGRKYEDGKHPVIVHCSDGQGLSGVFISLDIGIRSHEESKTSVVDLFELAKRLRQGRSGIINSLLLYNFSYQCLYEYTVNYDEEAEKKKDA